MYSRMAVAGPYIMKGLVPGRQSSQTRCPSWRLSWAWPRGGVQGPGGVQAKGTES